MSADNTSLAATIPTFSSKAVVVHRDVTAAGPVGGNLKRAMDVLMALSALIILLPIIIMVVILLRLTTRDSAVFGHQRVGHNGKPFRCLKFRTMVSNGDQVLAEHLAQVPSARDEWEANRKLREDPRVTAVGRILRSSSLDELPQIFNVLQGSMSIVGPRPIVIAEIEKYGFAYASYQSCRPGITGLWQVSGRSNCGYERRVELDDAYARGWSAINDCWIIWRTVGVVIKREGSC